MDRLVSRLSWIAMVAVACGGTSKPPPTAPLPDDKPAMAGSAAGSASAPAGSAGARSATAEPAPAPPATPAGPLEVKIPAHETTVKIVSGGSGKKEAVRYTAKAGAKQALELAMDFAGKQDAEEKIVPTIVLTGEVETRSVDNDGNSEYTLTVTGTDARAVAGSQVPIQSFKTVLDALSGLTIGGKLGATGMAGETTMRIEKPQGDAADTLELLRLTFPTLPVLPKEAIGVGARWQSTTVAKLADKLDITQVTDYELVAHTGKTWKIKGTTTITGKDQEIDTSKISAISGSGTSETTIAAGALYPIHKSSLETQFKASEKDKSTQLKIKVGGAVTPKTP
jgi:hypothetical protein